MSEPRDLLMARDHLAKAEAMLASGEGLYHLREGLALLERVIDHDAGTPFENVARNLGDTYTDRIYKRIWWTIESGENPTEPELEHVFAVVRAFDDACFDLPSGSDTLKVQIVRRLVDSYYEGHTAAEKHKAMQRLAEVERRDGAARTER
jgi:hypothetical protein